MRVPARIRVRGECMRELRIEQERSHSCEVFLVDVDTVTARN
jgi:hypothetical protein